MEWITTLLKHLAISRLAVVAVFVAASVLYFGPRFAPTYVDSVPKEWAVALMGILIFSGCIVIFWMFAFIWSLAKRGCKLLATAVMRWRLRPLEKNLLTALAENPNDSLDLAQVNYQALALTRLEVLQSAHGLSKKGLANINPYNENLVSLTGAGRKRALVLQRRSK